jgi:type I restriction enzyme S subunit
MTADKPDSLLPELRFPEFRSAGGWHLRPLSDIAELISDRVGTTKSVPMSVTTGVGLVSQEEKFGRTIAGDSYKNYVRLQTNDFAYNKSATKEFPQGYIARYSGTKDAAVPNSIFTCFRPHTAAVIPEYLDHLFHGNHHGRWLRKYVTVGARAHGALSVTDDDLMSMPVPLPPVSVSRSEQQKIADCLGSVGDLIEAERRRREALRQHKQGLMQQLLPLPGEAVPRLRFPEFHDAGEWTPHKFGDFVVKSFYGTSASTSETGHYPVLRMGNMVDGGLDFSNLVYIDLDREEFECFRLQKGDILLNRTNSRDLVGKVSIFDRDAECIPASYIVAFRLDENRIDPWFCNLMLNTQMLQSRIKLLATPSISQANINPSTFRTGLDIVIPTLVEQQRIATCLSSLDHVLAAQSRKVEGLKAHKQGLMQQLFPRPEEELL